MKSGPSWWPVIRVRVSSRCFLRLRRSRRRELRNVAEAERGFDVADRLLGIFESIFAEHLVLDVFELIGEFVELLVAEVGLPCGKDDRVFARRMIFIHANESFEGARQRLGVERADSRAARD